MILWIAFIILILSFFIKKTEPFYNPSKKDERSFEMTDHSYDGNLFDAEKTLYEMIKNTDNSKRELKDHLSELLNIIQSI